MTKTPDRQVSRELAVKQAERDPEGRLIDVRNPEQVREKMLDKTDADSFPASDPPSSIPDPHEDSFAA